MYIFVYTNSHFQRANRSSTRARLRAARLRAIMGDFSESHWDAVADKVAPDINALIDAYDETDDDGQIQALGAQIRGKLKATSLSKVEVVHHSRVAVASCNRDGEMLQTSNVFNLIEAFTRKGWNPLESSNAFAAEMPDGADGEIERTENRNLISKARGLLPNYHVSDATIITVAGSHTTSALRTIDMADTQDIKAIAALKHLARTDGCLSKQQILEKAPSLLQPTTEGIPYTIARKQIVKRCPRMLEVLSQADNAKHTNAQKETATQTMLNLHRQAVLKNATTDADWAKIAKQAARAHNKEFVQAAEHYAAFVRQYSGGKHPVILHLIDSHMKSFGEIREIPSEFYRDLSRIDLPHGAVYIAAMVMATSTAHESYCRQGGKARVFASEDILSIINPKTNKFNVQAALKIMIEAMGIADRAKLKESADPSRWAILQSMLFMNLVMHVHNKKSPGRKEYHSLNEIAVEFFDLLQKKFPNEIAAANITCPWSYVPVATAPIKSTTSAKAPTQGTKRSIRELTIDGCVSPQLLVEKGLKEGAKIRFITAKGKPPSPDHDIVDVSEDGLSFTLDDGTVLVGTQMLDYTVVEPEIKTFMEVPTPYPFEFTAELAKARIRLCLEAAFQEEGQQPVRIRKQPTKGVIATKAVKAGAIRLVPVTVNVNICAENAEAASSSAIVTGVLFNHAVKGKHKGVLSQPKIVLQETQGRDGSATKATDQELWAPPFWLVQTTRDMAGANMVFTTSKKGVGTSEQQLTTIFPIMKNSRPIEVGEELCVYKNNTEAKPNTTDVGKGGKGKKGKGKNK